MTAPTAADRFSAGEPAPAPLPGSTPPHVEADEGAMQWSGRPHLARRVGPGHGSSPMVEHRAVGGGKGRRRKPNHRSQPPRAP